MYSERTQRSGNLLARVMGQNILQYESAEAFLAAAYKKGDLILTITIIPRSLISATL